MYKWNLILFKQINWIRPHRFKLIIWNIVSKIEWHIASLNWVSERGNWKTPDKRVVTSGKLRRNSAWGHIAHLCLHLEELWYIGSSHLVNNYFSLKRLGTNRDFTDKWTSLPSKQKISISYYKNLGKMSWKYFVKSHYFPEVFIQGYFIITGTSPLSTTFAIFVIYVVNL